MQPVTTQTHAISVNPANGQQLAAYPFASDTQLDAALEQNHRAFLSWRQWSVMERAQKLRDLAVVLRDNAEAMAQMITAEMGKPITQARAEVMKSANLCDWYAEHGPAMLGGEATLVENNRASIGIARWAPSLRSCRGTSRCGKCYAVRCPFCWQVTVTS